MDTCPDKAAIVEERIDRILTQYRESPNLLGILRHDLEQVADAILAACDIPNHFDILTATGDQLTLLGKRLGWPRCHCVCTLPPIFGYVCDDHYSPFAIMGYCEVEGWPEVWQDTWATEGGTLAGSYHGCNAGGFSDYCFSDDEVYRGFLLARRYQALRRYGLADLEAAVQHIWGETASVINMGRARVCVLPGRDLSNEEMIEMPLAFRVLPFAPGVTTFIHYGANDFFGYEDGWSGYCDADTYFCPTLVEPYDCA